jgi:mycofactocin precursor
VAGAAASSRITTATPAGPPDCGGSPARTSLAGMENDTATLEPAETADDTLVEEELLVEEISIDGMCGVY